MANIKAGLNLREPEMSALSDQFEANSKSPSTPDDVMAQFARDLPQKKRERNLLVKGGGSVWPVKYPDGTESGGHYILEQRLDYQAPDLDAVRQAKGYAAIHDACKTMDAMVFIEPVRGELSG